MSFDALARDLAGTLAGVFGEVYQITRPGRHIEFDVPVIIRRNAEAVDGGGQVVMIEFLARIAKSTVEYQPKRGDVISSESVSYTLGKCIADTEAVWEFEASKNAEHIV